MFPKLLLGLLLLPLLLLMLLPVQFDATLSLRSFITGVKHADVLEDKRWGGL